MTAIDEPAPKVDLLSAEEFAQEYALLVDCGLSREMVAERLNMNPDAIVTRLSRWTAYYMTPSERIAWKRLESHIKKYDFITSFDLPFSCSDKTKLSVLKRAERMGLIEKAGKVNSLYARKINQFKVIRKAS